MTSLTSIEMTARSLHRTLRLILLVLLVTCAASSVFAQQNQAPTAAPSGSVISDDMLLAEYERFKTAIGDKEYHVSHILLVEKEAAQQVIERLDKGESFAELAKMYSRDPGSAKRGGDLGWNVATSFVPGFSKAMKELEPGKYTVMPIRTQFGWHVIEVEETRPAKIPPFEQIKESIRASMLAKRLK